MLTVLLLMSLLPTATLSGEDVSFNEEKQVFEVSIERYKLFVESEKQLDIALNLLDIKDEKIESLEKIISEQTGIINAKQIILDAQTQELKESATIKTVLIIGNIAFGITAIVETIILIAR